MRGSKLAKQIDNKYREDKIMKELYVCKDCPSWNRSERKCKEEKCYR